MALVPSIALCVRDACTTLVFRETTGVYNALTNTGGYGAPNPTVGSVTAATLTITTPDGTEYIIDALADGLVTSDEDAEYEIPLEDIGSPSEIEDGYWQFVYVVTTGSDYTATKTAIFTCNAACCVNSLLLDIDETDLENPSPSNLKVIENYIKAKVALDSLKHYAYCGNLDKVDSILAITSKLCANSGCDTCN